GPERQSRTPRKCRCSLLRAVHPFASPASDRLLRPVHTRSKPLVVPPCKPGHDILAIRGDLRRPDLEEKSLSLRTENSLFFSYIIILGHRSMRLKPGRLNSPPAERVSWPGLPPCASTCCMAICCT